MPYIEAVNPDQTAGKQKEIFGQINNAFGVVPNMFKVIGNSPAALQSMFGSFSALGNGKINTQLGEQIAVYVADINRCEYCLAAHTALGMNAGLSVAQMGSAQAGESSDAKTQAALDFSAKLVKHRAQISREDVQVVRNAGFSNEEIAEILAHVALNIFTNYTNIAFDVEVDFPKINLRDAA
jgi:uncharacterized peroxidase-related enzyme